MNRAAPQGEGLRILADNLASGWAARHPAYPAQVREAWAACLGARITEVECGNDSLRLRASLPGLRLHGADDVRLLMLGGELSDYFGLARNFLGQAPSGSLRIIASLSPAAERRVQALCSDMWLSLDREDLMSVWTNADGLDRLRRLLLERLSREYLNPFNYLRPVEGSMFTGRMRDLQRLRHEAEMSFAIAGPSRLGKTSLLLRYRHELVAARDPRSSTTHYLDWMPCKNLDYESIGEFLYQQLGGASHAHRLAVGQRNLPEYLRQRSEAVGGTVTLLCDEADLVCPTDAFRDLGVAAKNGWCRLILAGRAGLLRWMNHSASPLAARLVLLRLQPLDLSAARTLLLTPFEHLGLPVSEPDRVMEALFSWTGGMPHLLQFYGQRLVRLALERGCLDPEAARTVHLDGETAAHILADLQQIEDPLAYLTALLLLREDRSPVTVGLILDLCHTLGITGLTHQRAVEIADELVISNVLAWQTGEYVLINRSLREHAERREFLTRGLVDALAWLRRTAGASAVERVKS